MGTGAANKIAIGLRKFYPNTAFIKTGYCLKRTTGPYVEGLVIEATPYKEHCYVWAFVNTVWAKYGHHNLNYSERIAGGRYFNGPSSKVIDEIVVELSSNAAHLSRVVGPAMTPREFLQGLPFGIPPLASHSDAQRTEIIFDCAVAMLLIGDLDEGKLFLKSFLNVSSREQHYLRLCALEMLKSVLDGSQDFEAVILDMEMQGRYLNRLNIV